MAKVVNNKGKKSRANRSQAQNPKFIRYNKQAKAARKLG